MAQVRVPLSPRVLLILACCWALAPALWIVDRVAPDMHAAIINVRWTPGTTADERAALERRFALAAGDPLEGTTWRYALRDPSVANIQALVRHPAVADTHGIARDTLTVAPDAGRADHVLEGLGIATRVRGALTGASTAVLWFATFALAAALLGTVNWRLFLPSFVSSMRRSAWVAMTLAGAIVIVDGVRRELPARWWDPGHVEAHAMDGRWVPSDRAACERAPSLSVDVRGDRARVLEYGAWRAGRSRLAPVRLISGRQGAALTVTFDNGEQRQFVVELPRPDILEMVVHEGHDVNGDVHALPRYDVWYRCHE